MYHWKFREYTYKELWNVFIRLLIQQNGSVSLHIAFFLVSLEIKDSKGLQILIKIDKLLEGIRETCLYKGIKVVFLVEKVCGMKMYFLKGKEVTFFLESKTFSWFSESEDKKKVEHINSCRMFVKGHLGKKFYVWSNWAKLEWIYFRLWYFNIKSTLVQIWYLVLSMFY